MRTKSKVIVEKVATNGFIHYRAWFTYYDNIDGERTRFAYGETADEAAANARGILRGN